jgi:hypothetical protein
VSCARFGTGGRSTLTEINPGHASDESRSLRQLVAMLVDAIGPRARQ